MIQPEGLTLSSFTSVYAQHMTREAGNNCFDAEIGWYSSPFSDCSDVVITPSCQCQYCGTYFETNLTNPSFAFLCTIIPFTRERP